MILVTGGLGYIGSHCVVELLLTNYSVIVVDNLINSKIDVLHQIKRITNKDVIFYKLDVANSVELTDIFRKHNIQLVIHLAGLKSISEAVSNPLLYYNHNITASTNLFAIMNKYNVKNIIFSSSSTVYGLQKPPYKEDMETGVGLLNPYAKTKYIIEEILKDMYNYDNTWNITILRYFNPSGAHKSGLLNENTEASTNLMPLLLKVADNKLPYLSIYGRDYDTIDKTCIRDYIHVVDLAKGHIAAIHKMNTTKSSLQIYNLGSGIGYSVKQIIETFSKVNNIHISHMYLARRTGDLPISYADSTKANNELAWKTIYTLVDICADSWHAYQLCDTKKIDR